MPLLGSATKRLRWLHLGLDELYIDQIREEYLKEAYQPEYIGDYNLKILRGYAEAVAVTIVTCALQKAWRKYQRTFREQNLWD